MKWFRDLESVGWLFWAISFAILITPCYFLAKYITYDFSTGERIALGLTMAMVSAAVIAWAVNELLFQIHKRKYDERRKVERKRKRKKKK